MRRIWIWFTVVNFCEFGESLPWLFPRYAMLALVFVVVCPSHAGIVSKRLHESSWYFAYNFLSTYATMCFWKIISKNTNSSLSNFVPNSFAKAYRPSAMRYKQRQRAVRCWQRLAATADVHGTCGMQPTTNADIRRAALYTARWSIGCEGRRSAGTIGMSWYSCYFTFSRFIAAALG